MTPEWFANKLVDYVSTVTQLDPEKDELPNVDDWRRNAEVIIKEAIQAEREACAQLAQARERYWSSRLRGDYAVEAAALKTLIRARGKGSSPDQGTQSEESGK